MGTGYTVIKYLRYRNLGRVKPAERLALSESFSQGLSVYPPDDAPGLEPFASHLIHLLGFSRQIRDHQ